MQDTKKEENKYIIIWNEGKHISLPFTDILNVKEHFKELCDDEKQPGIIADLYLLTKVSTLNRKLIAAPPRVETVTPEESVPVANTDVL